MRSSALRAVFVWAVLAVVQPVAASGPVEQVVQVAFHPRDPDVFVLRYVNKGDGLFFTDDGGATWRMLCGDLAAAQLGREPGEGPLKTSKVVLTGDGALYGASFDGLWQADARGCGFRMVPEYDGLFISDLTTHPSDPDALWLTTGEYGQQNAVYERQAGGSFAMMGAADEAQIFRVRTAETDAGLRIYQSAINGTVPTMINGMMIEGSRYVIRVSDDGGESFEEFTVGDGSRQVELLAVDPQNPDRIVARHDNHGEPDEILVSSDRGQTFTSYAMVSDFKGIAIAGDGRVMIAEAPETLGQNVPTGIWFAPSLDEPPTKIAEESTFCVAYHAAEDAFYACLNKDFGRIESDGTFTSLFTFTAVQEFVACDGMDAAAACESQLCNAYCGQTHFFMAPVCAAYDSPTCGPCIADPELCGPTVPRGDAGATSEPDPDPAEPDPGAAGSEAPPAEEPPASRAEDGGCSCRTRPSEAGAPGAAALPIALALGLLLARRRRPRA